MDFRWRIKDPKSKNKQTRGWRIEKNASQGGESKDWQIKMLGPRDEFENVGVVLQMLGKISKCWGQQEHVGDNLKMSGTSSKCSGHPDDDGDIPEMLGTSWKCWISSTSPLTSTSPQLGPFSLGRAPIMVLGKWYRTLQRTGNYVSSPDITTHVSYSHYADVSTSRYNNSCFLLPL